MARFLIIFLLAGFIAVPAPVICGPGEKGPEYSRLIGRFDPKTDTWAEYVVIDKMSGKRSRLRLVIDGTVGDSFWYEVAGNRDDVDYIFKMLVKGDPIDPANIRRFIVKSGDGPVRELSTDSMVNQSRAAATLFERLSSVPFTPGVHLKRIKTGTGSATVPGGTFTVDLYRIIDTATGDVYAAYKYAGDVRPWGVVSVEARNTVIFLAGYGTGARLLITEEPMVSPGPAGIPERTVPDNIPMQTQKPGPEGVIRPIPGMGTGYEPKQ